MEKQKSTSIITLSINNKLIIQSKREAKRLLEVAAENAGTLTISKLGHAQNIVAKLKGKDSWHALNATAKSSSSGAEKLAANSIPIIPLNNAIDPTLKQSIQNYADSLLRLGYEAVNYLPHDASQQNDPLNYVLTNFGKKVMLMGFSPIQSLALRGGLRHSNIECCVVWTDVERVEDISLKDQVNLVGDKGFANFYSPPDDINILALCGSQKLETLTDIESFLTRQFGPRFLGVSEMSIIERSIFSIRAGAYCGVNSDKLAVMLRCGTMYTNLEPEILDAEAWRIIEESKLTDEWVNIKEIMGRHAYTSTLILGLYYGRDSYYGEFGQDLYLQQPNLYHAMISFTGDRTDYFGAGPIFHFFEELEANKPIVAPQVKVAARNMYGHLKKIVKNYGNLFLKEKEHFYESSMFMWDEGYDSNGNLTLIQKLEHSASNFVNKVMPKRRRQ